MTWEDFEGGLC